VDVAVGAPDTQNAVANRAAAMPASNFSMLRLLAAAVDGNKTRQSFRVTSNEGSSTTKAVSLSDWCPPQNYSGVTRVKLMTVRDTNHRTTVKNCPIVADLFSGMRHFRRSRA
jgi:hypothetical protein